MIVISPHLSHMISNIWKLIKTYHFQLQVLTHSLVTYLKPHHCPHPLRLSGHHFLAERVLPDLQLVSHSPDILHSRDPPGNRPWTIRHQVKEVSRVHLVMPSHDPVGGDHVPPHPPVLQAGQAHLLQSGLICSPP